jgi:hypothetical protein
MFPVVDSESLQGKASFDLLASSLRASSRDLGTYVRVLAEKLEAALPRHVRVERRRAGLLSSERVVVGVTCELGSERYGLRVAGGSAEATRATVVRGVVLKTEPLPLERWVDGLAAALAEEARLSEESRIAVERLLIG